MTKRGYSYDRAKVDAESPQEMSEFEPYRAALALYRVPNDPSGAALVGHASLLL